MRWSRSDCSLSYGARRMYQMMRWRTAWSSGGIGLDRLGVKDLAILFGDFEVGVVVFGKRDLLFVVAKFEVCHVVGLLDGGIVS